MSRVLRLGRIIRVFSRYRLDTFIDENQLPRAARTLLRLAPWRLRPVPDASRGERLRQALESLGPVFIKFGQMFSTRRDLLPEDIADELALPPVKIHCSVLAEDAISAAIADVKGKMEPAGE